MALDANGVLSFLNELYKTVILKFLPAVVNIIIAIIYSRVNTVSVPDYMAQIDGGTLSPAFSLSPYSEGKPHGSGNS
jgi:hypothetical protein